jgi:CBS domain-containing protein
MKTVRQILDKKGWEVYTVTPESTVFDALRLMAEKNIGAVVVVENKNVVGILSERDYARKVVLQGKTSRDTPVSEIMTEKVLYVLPKHTTDECMALMTDKRIRHLPVLDDGKLVGVVSIGDIVNTIIDEDKYIIGQLENYITGGR